ncbi:MAG: hypothetical protein E4G96_09610 [Chrysiogenales bacterium]|nr:MAG: hypothetical protein E4G96_09610 [Chrysiogenales bacterium]
MSEIGETYDHLQTKGLKSILELRILMKTRRLRESLNEFDTSIAFFDRIGERILHFESHTFKARALLLSGDISSAGECLDYLEKLYHEMDLIPFYKSDYRIARFMFDMHQLEDALNSEDKNRIREYRKKAKQSGKHSLKISRKFKRDRTEALKLAGSRRWLLGTAAVDGLLFLGKFLSGLRALRHYRAAVRWWKKSIDTGTRLGAKLELSRTYAEIGKHLSGRYLHVDADPEGGISHHHARIPRGIVRAHAFATKHIGITPEECLDRAEAMFREMGLEWDLAELEKVRLRL